MEGYRTKERMALGSEDQIITKPASGPEGPQRLNVDSGRLSEDRMVSCVVCRQVF
jgi:hypothetical protein